MKIFVSYSRRDADFAQQINDYFQDSGYDVFTDIKNIQAGAIWTSVIENNISDCDIFVVIITQPSLRSTEVEKEVLQAQRDNKKIIPCIHRDVSYDEIKWNLKMIQGIEFHDKYELSRVLYSKIAGKRKESPRPADDHITKRQRLSLKIIIPIVAVAIIGMIVSVSYFNGLSIFENKDPITPTAEAVSVYNKGNDLYYQGNYIEAMGYYDKALKIDPNYVEALIGKGEVFASHQNYNEAMYYYDKALDINSTSTSALVCKGNAFSNQKNYNEAIKYYDKALLLDPNFVYALNNKADALYKLSKYQEAIAWYDKTLIVDPKYTQAQENKKNSTREEKITGFRKL